MIARQKNSNGPVHFILFAICIALAGLLFIELNTGNPEAENTILPVASDLEKIAIPDINQGLPPITEFQEIINRPLFMENRQPYVQLEPEIESEEPDLQENIIAAPTAQQFMLTAVIITPETSTAIIQSGKNRELQHIIIGEKIDDWTLVEVHQQHIILKQGDTIQTVELEIKKSPLEKRQRPSQQPPEENTKKTGKNRKI